MHSGTDRLSGKSSCCSCEHTIALGNTRNKLIKSNHMTQENAKQVIAEALHIAIAKGCYGLIEVQNIVKALEVINDVPVIEFGEVEEA
jgi:hypothetical protein